MRAEQLYPELGQRQHCRNYAFRPHSSRLYFYIITVVIAQLYIIQTPKPSHFFEFCHVTEALIYVVALYLSQSYNIVACPALAVYSTSKSMMSLSWVPPSFWVMAVMGSSCMLFSRLLTTPELRTNGTQSINQQQEVIWDAWGMRW